MVRSRFWNNPSSYLRVGSGLEEAGEQGDPSESSYLKSEEMRWW